MRGEPSAAVVADRRVLDPEALAQRERLGEVARGHAHLVALGAQHVDHRPHDEHVGRVGEVDPDAHDRGGHAAGAARTAAVLAGARSSSGLIGIARWVRARLGTGSSGPGRSPRPSAPAVSGAR